jgi:hypothetical protein
MDPSDMEQFIAEQGAVADPEHAASEALTAEKHQKYLLNHRLKYDQCREKILEKLKAKYVSTCRSVCRPRLPKELKHL